MIRPKRAIACLLTALLGAPVAHADCAKKIPAALRKQIQADAPAWRLMETADLPADDQKVWRKINGGCPSVAKANFDGSGRPQYFLLLYKPGGLQTWLLFYTADRKGRFKKEIDDGPDNTHRLPVISAQPAGTYSSRDEEGGIGPTFTARHPMLVWAFLESSAWATYHGGRAWQTVLISE